jgi:hypothetical protein
MQDETGAWVHKLIQQTIDEGLPRLLTTQSSGF